MLRSALNELRKHGLSPHRVKLGFEAKRAYVLLEFADFELAIGPQGGKEMGQMNAWPSARTKGIFPAQAYQVAASR